VRDEEYGQLPEYPVARRSGEHRTDPNVVYEGLRRLSDAYRIAKRRAMQTEAKEKAVNAAMLLHCKETSESRRKAAALVHPETQKAIAENIEAQTAASGAWMDLENEKIRLEWLRSHEVTLREEMKMGGIQR
jgi:hypothetical protein